jgi:hypothetical protein
MMNIRWGKDVDADRAVELLAASHAAAGFDDAGGPTGFVVPFDPWYARRLFFAHLAGERTCCLVGAVDDAPQGLLLAAAHEHAFGPVWLARETVWWIDPAHRGLGAWRMLEAFEQWVAMRGYQFSGMAGMGEDPIVEKLYLRRGYRKAETHYLKAV